MLLIISDASVLIDIECGKLTNDMFNLPLQFAVPDTLFAEELSERHSHLLQLGLISKTMSGDLVAEAYDLHQKYLKPSVNDMLALTLARHEHCQLLTGDKALREVAEKLNVEVHGTIWLIEKMLYHETIAVEIARAAFQQMKNSGSRLPWSEVEKTLSKYELLPKRRTTQRARCTAPA
jgi:predicted nucleic acid-binding protein